MSGPLPHRDWLLLCVALIEAAYLGRSLRHDKLDDCHFVELGDIRANVARHNTQGTIVAFAGTDSLADWSFNLDRSITVAHGIKWHSGFLKHAQYASAAITSQCREAAMALNGAEPLTVTGHSLGGAAAICFSRHAIGVWTDATPRVVTFGSPKPVSGQFPPWADIVNLVTDLDPVPRFPRGSRWTTPGLTLRLSSDGLMTWYAPSAWDRAKRAVCGASDAVLAAARPGRLILDTMIEPHLLSTYRSRIEAKA